MKNWQMLLGDQWEGVGDEYGPQSQIVVSALEVLGKTAWFKQAGMPKPETVISVSSWESAIGPLNTRTNPYYGPNGHLLAPTLVCAEVIESDQYHALWQLARQDAFDYYNIRPYLPKTLPETARDFVDEYIYEFVSFLLAEIIGDVQLKSTYFREMLAWFHAGYFPCGWEGMWPEGQQRVY